MANESRSAFFYGTLLAPQVLYRVCYGTKDPNDPLVKHSKIKTFPAILHDHRRHRVRDADYPAIVPHAGSTVRGTYATGLTDADIWRLDLFEGDEYSREVVKPRLLVQVGDADGKGNVEGEEVEAETYVWIAGERRLEDAEWDFSEFQREKMAFWIGAEGEGEFAGRSFIIGQRFSTMTV